MDDLRHVIASEVNDEVVVVFGATSRELKYISAMVGVVTLIVALAIGIAIGRVAPVLAVATVLGFVAIGLIARGLQVIKRGHPAGYVMQQLMIWRGRLGLGPPAPFLELDGPLSTRRTEPRAVIGRHLPRRGFDE